MHSLRHTCLLLASLFLAGVQSHAAEPLPMVASGESVLRMLPQLHLLEPVWAAPVVRRESFVLLQAKDDGPLVGRLALGSPKSTPSSRPTVRRPICQRATSGSATTARR